MSRADEAAAARLQSNPIVRTFDEVFGEMRLTYPEREALVHHLASLRYRKTLEALLPNTLSALRKNG
jgi:hypothetical protein